MPNPCKNYFYNLAYGEIKKFNFSNVLDCACGRMDFLNYFSPKNYLGIDIDSERLELGKRKFPHAKIKNCDLFDLKLESQFDLILCFETLGITKHFNSEKSLEAIKKILNYLSEDGHFVFNIKNKKYISEINDYLFKNKKIIVKIKKKYGFFDKKMNIYLYYLIVKFSKFFNFFKLGNSYTFYIIKKIN